MARSEKKRGKPCFKSEPSGASAVPDLTPLYCKSGLFLPIQDPRPIELATTVEQWEIDENTKGIAAGRQCRVIICYLPKAVAIVWPVGTQVTNAAPSDSQL